MYRSSVCSLDLSGNCDFPYEANDNFELPAQVRKPRTRNKSPSDRLHLAVWNNNTELVRELVLEKGIFVEAFNFMGQTPLFVATYTGKLSMTSELLQLGANPNICCIGGYTATHGACFSGSTRILTLILKFEGDLEIYDVNRQIPIDWAFYQPDEKKRNRILAFIESFRQARLKRMTSSSSTGSGMSPTAVMVASSAAAAMAPVTREDKRRKKKSQSRKSSSFRYSADQDQPVYQNQEEVYQNPQELFQDEHHHHRHSRQNSSKLNSIYSSKPVTSATSPRSLFSQERVTHKPSPDYTFSRRFLEDEESFRPRRERSDVLYADKNLSEDSDGGITSMSAFERMTIDANRYSTSSVHRSRSNDPFNNDSTNFRRAFSRQKSHEIPRQTTHEILRQKTQELNRSAPAATFGTKKVLSMYLTRKEPEFEMSEIKSYDETDRGMDRAADRAKRLWFGSHLSKSMPQNLAGEKRDSSSSFATAISTFESKTSTPKVVSFGTHKTLQPSLSGTVLQPAKTLSTAVSAPKLHSITDKPSFKSQSYAFSATKAQIANEKQAQTFASAFSAAKLQNGPEKPVQQAKTLASAFSASNLKKPVSSAFSASHLQKPVAKTFSSPVSTATSPFETARSTFSNTSLQTSFHQDEELRAILELRRKKLSAATSESQIATPTNAEAVQVTSKTRFNMFGDQIKPRKTLARTRSEMIRPEPVLAGSVDQQRNNFFRTKSDLGKNGLPSKTYVPDRPSIKPASHSTEKQTFKEVPQFLPAENEHNGLTAQAVVKPVGFTAGQNWEEPQPQDGLLTAQSSLESTPYTQWVPIPPPPPAKPKKSPGTLAGIPRVRQSAPPFAFSQLDPVICGQRLPSGLASGQRISSGLSSAFVAPYTSTPKFGKPVGGESLFGNPALRIAAANRVANFNESYVPAAPTPQSLNANGDNWNLETVNDFQTLETTVGATMTSSPVTTSAPVQFGNVKLRPVSSAPMSKPLTVTTSTAALTAPTMMGQSKAKGFPFMAGSNQSQRAFNWRPFPNEVPLSPPAAESTANDLKSTSGFQTADSSVLETEIDTEQNFHGNQVFNDLNYLNHQRGEGGGPSTTNKWNQFHTADSSVLDTSPRESNRKNDQATKPVQILEFNNDGETEFHWGSAGRQPFGNPSHGLMTTAAVDIDQAIAGTAWQTLHSETVLEQTALGAEWHSASNAADNRTTNQNWESANQNSNLESDNQTGALETAQTEAWESNQPNADDNWESANQNEGWENVQSNQNQQAWESPNQNDAWQSAQPAQNESQTVNWESALPKENEAWPASPGGEGDAHTCTESANNWDTIQTNNDQAWATGAQGGDAVDSLQTKSANLQNGLAYDQGEEEGNIAQNSQNNWETLPTASTWESATENNNQEYGNQNGNQEQSHNEELRDYSSEGQEVVDEFETVDTDEDGSAAWGSQDNFDEAWGDSVDWGTAQNIESPEQEAYDHEWNSNEEVLRSGGSHEPTEHLLQTVWTDDVPTDDDESENYSTRPENFCTRPEQFSIPDEDSIPDEEYDDPSHEIAIHIQEPEDDAAANRTGRRLSTEDLYCDDEFQTNLLNNPTMQLSVSRLNCHSEESDLVYPPTPMLLHRDSILTLDDENSSGPSSLESDLAESDNFRTLESQDEIGPHLEQDQNLDGSLEQNQYENDQGENQEQDLDENIPDKDVNDDACHAIQIDLEQVATGRDRADQSNAQGQKQNEAHPDQIQYPEE